MHYIVKISPEITIKSSPVRKRLTKQLRDNLRRLLKALDRRIDVQRDWEKLDVVIPGDAGSLREPVETVLASTPGINQFSRVDSHPLGDLDDILDKARGAWAQALAGKTFCVRVKRSGRHDFRSVDVERYVGGGLLKYTDAAGVKLVNPDVTVPLEVRGDKFFLVHETRRGLGGFPIGSRDNVLSLVSGGFDSTVASYLTMRRGLRTHFCFFNLGGRAHELGVKEVSSYLWRRFGASHRVKFVTVPFEGVVTEILTRVGNAYMGVVLKRMMLRAATRIAGQMEVETLVTGESVSQVSSQTLHNLAVIDQVSEKLIFRPLSVMDKEEIIKIARTIGTEEYAANMPEYCGVISVRPTTRAKPERVISEEAGFDFGVLDRAVAEARYEAIDDLQMDAGAATGVEIFSTPQPGSVILDIRHPDEIAGRSLKAGNVPVKEIPFFTLAREFPNLEPATTYLLYCDRGVMSRLHAEMLREEGYENVGVYRPG
jgi:thiamine biosynthesis protein ThiI